jgi:hypothetical protein
MQADLAVSKSIETSALCQWEHIMSDTTVQTPAACCGTAAAAVDGAVEPQAVVSATPAPCCGTAEGAKTAGACCDPAAKTEAVTAGAGCCG